MIWVIGAKGMLGTDMVLRLRDMGKDLMLSDVECDVRDIDSLRAKASQMKLDWIVNCCAYTNVDKAEDDEAMAVAINSDGPENIAAVAQEAGARLIHLSTDYVFDGRLGRAYTEEDSISPVGVYARSKAEGENRVLARLPDAFILRTAWLYGQYGPNFVLTMLRLMREQDAISVVSDQHGSPTWTETVCTAVAAFIEQASPSPGIYHAVNDGHASWYEFAHAIQDEAIRHGLLKQQCKIRAIGTKDYPTPAQRPPYSVLCCDKLETALGWHFPHWRKSLSLFLQKYARSMGER